VDNCKTHYYKLIDGQRICQFGHVYEGHVEYNDDEDEPRVVTKTLKFPNPSQTNKSFISQIGLKRSEKNSVLYGAAGKELYLTCYQFILRSQAKFLIEKFDLPEILETVVKSTWIDFVTLVLPKDLEFISAEETESYVNDANPESDMIEEDDYQFRKVPILMHSLSILYISCRYLQLPIYLNDIVSLSSTDSMPYMRASFILPTHLRKRLSKFLLGKFEPRPPLKGEVCVSSLTIITRLRINTQLNFNYEPLLIRLINEFVLPPRVYQAAKNIIKLIDMKFAYPNLIHTQHANRSRQSGIIPKFPDAQLALIVMIAAKIYFMNPELNKPAVGNDPKSVINYQKWKRIFNSYKRNIDDSKNFNSFLQNLTTSANSNSDILKWDEKETTKYLDWFEKTQIDHKRLDDTELSIPMRRLYTLFNLEDGKYEPDHSNNEVNATSLPGVKNLKSAYRRLFQPVDELHFNPDDNKPVGEHEMLEIEKIFMGYLSPGFGIQENHLRRRSRTMESEITKTFTRTYKY
jgi:RNA polymerase I-specific transcription initiation factor RRN7